MCIRDSMSSGRGPPAPCWPVGQRRAPYARSGQQGRAAHAAMCAGVEAPAPHHCAAIAVGLSRTRRLASQPV
eukprot:7666920-Alexandrium_andersonii.AAC.1